MSNTDRNTLYLPRIAAQDFEAFRKIMKDEIAATFQEWLERRRERIAYYERDILIEVNVRPDEFVRFCHAESLAYNGRSLLDFAEFIGKANK